MRMANDSKHENGLQNGFWKTRLDELFQIFKFGTEITEILQNCCYITKFLHEIAFQH